MIATEVSVPFLSAWPLRLGNEKTLDSFEMKVDFVELVDRGINSIPSVFERRRESDMFRVLPQRILDVRFLMF